MKYDLKLTSREYSMFMWLLNGDYAVILLADVKVYNLMFKQCYFYVLQGTFSTQFYF